MPIPSRVRPRFERRLLGNSTAGRTIEAYGPIERSSGASSIFRGCVLNGRDLEDETPRTGRFRCPEDYQRRREKRRRERIERGILIGLDISLPVDASYRFPHSEIEAIGSALEERRQLYYRAPNPSCSFYVITEEAYCCLRGFVRYLGHLP